MAKVEGLGEVAKKHTCNGHVQTGRPLNGMSWKARKTPYHSPEMRALQGLQGKDASFVGGSCSFGALGKAERPCGRFLEPWPETPSRVNSLAAGGGTEPTDT